jgi:hypothetical protein
MKLTVCEGLPHNTTVIVRWTNTDSLPDGSRYENHGVHVATAIMPIDIVPISRL